MLAALLRRAIGKAESALRDRSRGSSSPPYQKLKKLAAAHTEGIPLGRKLNRRLPAPDGLFRLLR
jgi:hypothetical protein